MAHFPTGNVLPAIPVTSTKYLAVTTLNQLQSFGLLQPSLLEKVPVNDLRNDPNAYEARQLRAAVQRRFTKERTQNALDFADYIRRVEVEKLNEGGTPVITIYAPVSTTTPEGLSLRFNTPLIAIDGETQTQARFILRETYPETGDHPVAIVIYTNISYQAAKQIVVDVNHHGLNMSPKLVGNLDENGHLSRSVTEAISLARLRADDISRDGDTGGVKTVAARRQLLHASVGFVNGPDSFSQSYNMQFDRLNDAGRAAVFNGACSRAVASLLEVAVASNDLRRLQPSGWQAAGVILASGRSAADLNIVGTMNAIKQAKTTTNRLRSKDVLDIAYRTL